MMVLSSTGPRFSITVNSRSRITRDYAYFLENRLRARFALDGIPLVLDLNERGGRDRGAGAARESRGRDRRRSR